MFDKKMTLGRRVLTGQAVVTSILLLVGGVGLFTINHLRGTVDAVATVESRKLDLTSTADAAVATILSACRGMVLAAMTGDAGRIETFVQQLQGEHSRFDNSVKEMTPLLTTEEGKRKAAELTQQSLEFKNTTALLAQTLRGQRFDEATKILAEKVVPLGDKMDINTNRIFELQRGLLAKALESANTSSSRSTFLMVGVLILAIVVAAIVFRSVAASNISLRNICSEIAEGARQVASASKQVSSSSQALAQGSSEQAASLEETSASAEEINSMTQKNAENASSAARETENADKLLAETTQKLGQMISSMKEINTSSEKISRIIRVIDEIAFQTNILALNAAVEAARAGEAGMGFAVVADEVRNLAQRCAQAAKDTSDLIEESIVRSQEGKGKLDDVAAWVNRVVENASRIKVLANEVHMGSQEQARGIEQIARAVTQMQQVTQSTAASAEEGASAGEEMSAQATSLNDAVSRLSDLVGGEETAAFVPGRASALPAKALHHPGSPKQPQRPVHQPARDSFPLDSDFRDF